MMDYEELESARSHSLDNEMEILASKECGCFFCRSHFSARDVADWDYQNGHTQAICPECGMASVIGDASGYEITKDFLKEMNLAFYGPDYIRSHPEATRVYLDRFFEGKVTQNEKNEKLMMTYLKALVANEDVQAALTLASIYETGSHHEKADPSKAEKIYLLPFLKNNSRAQTRLGALYLGGYKGQLNRWQAFECLVKAVASGSYEGIFLLAHCYFFGFFVDADPEYGMHLLYDTFPAIYDAFLASPTDYGNLIDYAYRIGVCYEEGVGVPVDEERALRYYLLSNLGLETKDFMEKQKNHGELEENLIARLSAMARKFGFQKAGMVFDQDTFFDSFIDGNQGDIPRELIDFSFDPEAHTVNMEIEFKVPTILIDEESLNATVMVGKTQWRFTGVNHFEGTKNAPFHIVSSPAEGVWQFSDGDNKPVAATIIFDGIEDGE